MTDYVTQNELKRVVNEAVDDMAEIVSGFAQQIADKFSIADVRFDMLEAQLIVIREQLEKNEHSTNDVQKQLSILQTNLTSLRQFVRRATQPVASLQLTRRKGWLATAATARRPSRP